MQKKHSNASCPCGSGQTLDACCGRYLAGKTGAPDAAALMRSRYTAYVLGNAAYLSASWHASTRPAELDLTEEPCPQWIGLEVKHHHIQDACHATVEFVARYRVNGRAHGLHELSRFVCEDGCWCYVDGDILA